ncbi:MAG: hypothetical protein J6X71_09105 [Bacteroidales bacterium]|nr:hypothetical protein [Bacteroidales bacterium]
MKKYLFIAVAALAASVACTKVNTEATQIPVKFQAANYVPQTKAGEVSVLNDFEAFKCMAYLHAEGIDLNADGTVNGTSYQNFFGATGETISPDNTTNPTEWAPSHTYYWPKGTKSFVNFIGWYGVDGNGADSAPTITYAYDGTASKYKATMVWDYTSVAGNSASNLLYADMAWRFKANNDPATYGLDSVSEGVPMLFHHALAQINVKVYADGTSLTAGTGNVSDANATWTIALESPAITPVYNAGTLTLTNEDPGTASTPQAWTGSWAGTGTTGDITAATLNVDKITKATANTLFNATCVVPQTIGATVVLNFNMRITTTYKTAPTNPNVELIPISIKLNDMGTTAWAQNTKYTYYIKIVPSQKEVLFDPALEADWTEVEGTEQTI